LIVFLVGFSGYVHGQKECDAIIDLTLIIDSSGSIKPNDFEKGKEALMDLVSRLNVDVKKAGVAIVNYASNLSLSAQTEVFQFDKPELLKQIAALPRLGTRTATGDALALAKSYCDARCRDVTEGIPRIFAVFTDGHSNEGQPAIPAAQSIRDLPTEGTIFAIGIGDIGKTGQDELLGIAGDQDYVLNIDSYLDLARVTNAITIQLCEFPAFVLPDVKILSQVKGNNTRYYKMNTLHKTAKNAFFEIEMSDKAGQSVVYTSTTNKKPTSYSSRSIARRTATGKIYTTYVPANAKNFYFSVKGLKSNVNQFDFVVRVRPLNF
jgi:uncharacterized protein YegL